MKTTVRCSQCGKLLFETNLTERGRIAHEVQQRGYIAKLPFLYGHNRFEFFCDKNCSYVWFTENCSKEQLEEGNKKHSQLSKEMKSDEFVSGLQKGLDRIQRAFRVVEKRRRNGKI